MNDQPAVVAIPPSVQMWGGLLATMVCNLAQNQDFFRALRDEPLPLSATGTVDYGTGTIQLIVEAKQIVSASDTAIFQLQATDMQTGKILSNAHLKHLTAYLRILLGASAVQEVNGNDAFYFIDLKSIVS